MPHLRERERERERGVGISAPLLQILDFMSGRGGTVREKHGGHRDLRKRVKIVCREREREKEFVRRLNQSQALLETALERAGDEDSGDEEEMAKEEDQNAFSVRIIGALNSRKSALTTH